MVRPLWKTFWGFFRKANTELPYDPAVMYPKEFKTETWIDIYTPRFTAALFTITPKWKQAKWPLTDECINKHGLYTEHYSALKRNEILIRYNMNEPWNYYAKWNACSDPLPILKAFFCCCWIVRILYILWKWEPYIKIYDSQIFDDVLWSFNFDQVHFFFLLLLVLRNHCLI